MTIFERLRGWFQRDSPPPVETIPLSFEMEMTEEGRHRATVRRGEDGTPVTAAELEPLFTYGYHEEAELPDKGPVVRRVAPDDYRTLRALKSMEPVIDPDGTMTFDVRPRHLAYLRTTPTVQEGARSRRLTIESEPLIPTAEVDYQPDEGLTLRTGYRLTPETPLVPHDELRRASEDGYVRRGETFHPLPTPSEEALSFLETPVRQLPPSDVPEFFMRDLVLLRNEFDALLTDLAQEIRIVRAPIEPVVRVNGDERGWLDFEVHYRAGEIPLPAHLFAAQPEEPFVRVDATTWVATDQTVIDRTAQQLDALGAEATARGYRVPASEFVSLEAFIASIGGQAELSSSYEDFLAQLTSFQHDPTFRLPAPIEAHLEAQGLSLRPYQRAGIHWLYWLHRHHLHGILADDMGLGKTLQSICLLRLAYEESHSRQHSLIIAPKSVLHHWEREIQRCFPTGETYRYHGSQRHRAPLQADRPIIFISTYSTVARNVDALAAIPFFYLVLDEATYIKNPSAQRTAAVKALSAAHRLALSGTPVENRPAELWSIYNFLMRGHLGKFGTFKRLFEDEIMEENLEATERLGRRIRPFLLRRLKEEVAADLPEKIEFDEWCELTVEQRLLYGEIQGRARAIRDALARGERVNYATSILPVLGYLKQVCDHPALITKEHAPLYGRSEKFDWTVDKIEEIHRLGEQVVLFSHYLGMLDLLELALQQRRISYVRIDGSTNNRQRVIDRFNDPAGPTVALCSLMAAGQGINMQAANHVIHVDRWWNPAIEDQATDRVHRLGQTNIVHVYRILVEGTLEERINDILEQKRDMTDRIIEAASSGGSWTRDELLELLRPLD